MKICSKCNHGNQDQMVRCARCGTLLIPGVPLPSPKR